MATQRNVALSINTVTKKVTRTGDQVSSRETVEFTISNLGGAAVADLKLQFSANRKLLAETDSFTLSGSDAVGTVDFGQSTQMANFFAGTSAPNTRKVNIALYDVSANDDMLINDEFEIQRDPYEDSFATGTTQTIGTGNVGVSGATVLGSVPFWSDTLRNLDPTGYTVETALVGGSGALVRADAIKTYVDAQIGGGGGSTMPIATYDPAGIAEQLVGLTATQVLSNKTLTLPQINDTSADHQYVFAVSELTADRTVTLPLLTGADEFVFKDHAVTLTNKTISLGNNTMTFTSAQMRTGCSDETGTGSLVFADTPTLVTPILGTPTSGVLTNCTGLPITGITSSTSAEIATWCSDETGSGSLVFGTSPTIVTPTIADLTNMNHDHSNAAGGGTIARSDVTGTTSIGEGGTGQTTQTAAFDALSPTTTKGDLVTRQYFEKSRADKNLQKAF